MSDVDEVQYWIDHQAITALINRYSDAVTRADWNQLESVFADDGVIHVADPFNFHAEGARSIRDVMSEGAHRNEFLIHQVTSIVVHDIAHTTARATSTATEMGRGVSPGLDGQGQDLYVNFLQHAVYFDDLVKSDREWRFARRYAQPLYFEDSANTGMTIADRHQLLRTATFPPPT